MQNHSNTLRLQRKIMRRIYFLFIRRVATHTITLQIGIFVLALYMFGKVVFVKRVIENLMSTNIAHMPSFLFNAFVHSEVLTMMTIGVMVYVLLSVPLQLRAQYMSHMPRSRMLA